jgi:hypothetical protein
MKSTTQQARLTEALLNGEQLTVPQMAARFDMANPTAVISNIRFAGYAVYANSRKNSKGQTVTRYRIGTPSRKIIAAGNRALASGMVV